MVTMSFRAATPARRRRRRRFRRAVSCPLGAEPQPAPPAAGVMFQRYDVTASGRTTARSLRGGRPEPPRSPPRPTFSRGGHAAPPVRDRRRVAATAKCARARVAGVAADRTPLVVGGLL